MNRVADDLRARGYNPFIIPWDDINNISLILEPVGWINAADELTTQLKDKNIDARYVVLTVGGGGTQAGLVLGSKYLRASWQVIGMSVLNSKDDAVATVMQYIDAASNLLGLGIKVVADDFEINDSHIGEGYSIATQEGIDAIRLLAQTEGIFLDPAYTGKAMAGLIDLVKKGRFKSTDTIVFIHTGGIPALFAYHKEISRGK